MEDPEENYLEINRQTWNKKVIPHLNSEFYNMPAFLNGKTSLKNIELELLGDISGLSILHLQCHFGQDSISLSRMGANVTAIDLSDESIRTAKELAIKTSQKVKFVNSGVYDLPNHLDGKFDMVFTSYGTITWLPDLDKWAKVISHFLSDNGRFLIVDFHPFVWMFDDDFKFIKYNYFKDKGISEVEIGTYADKNSRENYEFVSWNHSVSELLSALIDNGIGINSFREYDYSPYNCLNAMLEVDESKYRIEKFDKMIPITFSLDASKERISL